MNELLPAAVLTVIHLACSPQFWGELVRSGPGHEYKVMVGTLNGKIGWPWNRRPLAMAILSILHIVLRNFTVAVVVFKLLLLWAILVLYHQYSGANEWAVWWMLAAAGVWMNQRFSTYLDLVWLLLALVLWQHPSMFHCVLIIWISSAAGFTRESFVWAFPVLALQHGAMASQLTFVVTCAGLFCFTLWMAGLEESRALTCPQHAPGWQLVKRNLLSPWTWVALAATFWPLAMVATVPAWLIPSLVGAVGVSLWYGNMRESALLLNPFVLLAPYLGGGG